MLQIINTAVTTVGAGSLSAAAILGGVITRTGPTGGFVDTTDTATNIISALAMGHGTSALGVSWIVYYINGVAQTCTFTGGTGVTVNGGASASIAGNTVSTILFTTVAGGTVAAKILCTLTQP